MPGFSLRSYALGMQFTAALRLLRQLVGLRPMLALAAVVVAAAGVQAQTPVAHPISVKRETRTTAKLSPSSGLDARSALVAANTIAAHIPGARVFTVMATGSMRPTFDEKAFLVVEPTPYEKLQVGDVITFLHPKMGAPIVHRIFEKRGEAFWTKGDYNARPDNEYVTRDNYGMRVVAVIYGREDSHRVAGLAARQSSASMLN